MKILVSDKLSSCGLKILRQEEGITVDERHKAEPQELKAIIGDYTALIVRSGTKVTGELIEAADKLKVIGRAGVGVDNIDVVAAGKRKIVVMNTPEGNTISTAEHTIGMMLALSRNIPQAASSLKEKLWERSKFTGVELYEKTLGVIGLGKIGSEVAKRAAAFGMGVTAYDPIISPEKARSLSVELLSLEELLSGADFITLHVPLNKETRHLLGDKEFQKVKKGVRVINCARGGLIDEDALYRAVKEKRVSGAALDVYEEEPPFASPLLGLDCVVAVPHLGAATTDAQERVAVDIAHKVVDFLKNGSTRDTVNG